MSKTFKIICEELRREIRGELKRFLATVERELIKILRGVNMSLSFNNEA